MELSYTEINRFLQNHQELLSFPGLHPNYVSSDALRDKSLASRYFIYEKQGEVFYHPFHTHKIDNTSFFEIISAYGYGGPISTCLDNDFLNEVAQEFKTWCSENKIIVETIRFHPLLQNWRYYHGESIPKRNTVYVDLTVDDLLNSYLSSARRAIKIACKNNVSVRIVECDEFMEVFPSLYYERMKMVNAKQFYFFNEEYFKNISKMDFTYKIFAECDGVVIGGGIFFIQNRIMEYLLYATNEQGKQFQATNLILHESFLFAKSKGCTYAHLGGGVGAEANDPVFVFKFSLGRKIAEYRIGKYIHNQALYEEFVNNQTLQVR